MNWTEMRVAYGTVRWMKIAYKSAALSMAGIFMDYLTTSFVAQLIIKPLICKCVEATGHSLIWGDTSVVLDETEGSHDSPQKSLCDVRILSGATPV
jgi:hypothetical protein